MSQDQRAFGGWRDWIVLVPVVLVALVFCWRWAGPIVLDPQSIGWLAYNDRAQHTLGWWFFRDSPWNWPPGLSPRYGIELATGIGLVDGLPLLALPFKLISPWLPPVFQYWGLWFLLCFALQAAFGFALARALDMSRLVSSVAALFAVAFPAFLMRLTEHMALGGGHWLILAALWLYVKREPPRLYAWPLLLGLAAAVHPTLMTIAGAIWLASIAERLWRNRIVAVRALLEFALGIAAMLLVLWAAGVLQTSSYTSFGYGRFSANLLAFLDPDGWSRIIPDLAGTERTPNEGFNFLGLGILLLVPLVVPLSVAHWRTPLQPRWLPLLVCCLALTLFAITHRPAFLDRPLFELPLPGVVEDFANIFRSSGRMLWPVGYLVTFALLLGAARWLGRLAAPVLLVLLATQIFDTSPGWARFRPAATAATTVWPTSMNDPLWQRLAPHYERVRVLPVQEPSPYWFELSYFAWLKGLATDAVYLSRVDGAAYAAAQTAGEEALQSGSFDPSAIYVLSDEDTVSRVAWHVEPGDLYREIDGYYVFARGGKQYAE